MKMNRSLIAMLLASLTVASASATTALTIGSVTLNGVGGPCWDDTLLNPPAVSIVGSFTLAGVSGTGYVTSYASHVVNNAAINGGSHILYKYYLDMSQMGPTGNHCVKLLVHFGPPLLCSYQVMLLTNGVSAVNPSSATLATYGDINFVFGGGCLNPGQTGAGLGMLSDTSPTTNAVTVIDDYTDPGSGLPAQTRVNVSALVPGIPPNWAFPPVSIPDPLFQGLLYTNNYPPPSNGQYSLTFQIMDAASNGLPVSPTYTQTVQVVNGLFTAPMHFDPTVFNGNPGYLKIGVKSAVDPGPIAFLSQALPLTPTPQAFYAYSAGVVAQLSPGQAVTKVNGLSDILSIVPGQNIQIFNTNNVGTNATSTITISAFITSDRNLKTDLTPVSADDVLKRVAALPIGSWRFKNEPADIRHLGPMAQDFMETFGLGHDNKTIGIGDEGGVALAAIQGLNEKVESAKQKAERDIQELKVENAALKQRLETLEKIIRNQKSN